MRAKGAISLGVANAAKAGGLGSRCREGEVRSCSRTTWPTAPGAASPAIPTTRRACRAVPAPDRPSPISANFAACSICEQTGGSCKGPASRNGIVNLLTTKGILMDGGYGYQKIGDRAGIHCRTVADTVKVLDAAKGFESSDAYTALPKAMIPKEPYASFLGRGERGRREAAEGHAHCGRALVHDQAHEERRGDLGSDRWRDQGRAARQARRGAGRGDRSEVSRRPVGPEPEIQLRGCVPRNPAEHRAGILLAEERGRHRSSSRCRAGTSPA